jgi:hypothetical protein
MVMVSKILMLDSKVMAMVSKILMTDLKVMSVSFRTQRRGDVEPVRNGESRCRAPSAASP